MHRQESAAAPRCRCWPAPAPRIGGVADMAGKTIATLRFPSNTNTTPKYLLAKAGVARELPGIPARRAGAGGKGRPRRLRRRVRVGREHRRHAVRARGRLQPGRPRSGPTPRPRSSPPATTSPPMADTAQRLVNAVAASLKLIHTEPGAYEAASAKAFPLRCRRTPRSSSAARSCSRCPASCRATRSSPSRRMGRHAGDRVRRVAETDAAVRAHGRQQLRRNARPPPLGCHPEPADEARPTHSPAADSPSSPPCSPLWEAACRFRHRPRHPLRPPQRHRRQVGRPPSPMEACCATAG